MRRISKTINLLRKFKKFPKFNYNSTIRQIPKYYFSNKHNNEKNPKNNKNQDFGYKKVYPKTWYEEYIGPVKENAIENKFKLELLKLDIEDLLFLFSDDNFLEIEYDHTMYIQLHVPIKKNSRTFINSQTFFKEKDKYFYLLNKYKNYLNKMEEISPELEFNAEYLKIKKQFFENLFNDELSVRNIKFILYFNLIENTILNKEDFENDEFIKMIINKSLSQKKNFFNIMEIPEAMINIQYLQVYKLDLTFFENDKKNYEEIFYNEELEFVYQTRTENEANLDQEDRDFSELVSLYIFQELNNELLEANIVINTLQKTAIDKTPTIYYEHSQRVLKNVSGKMNDIFYNIKQHLKENKKFDPNKIDSILQNIFTEEINLIFFKRIKEAKYLLKILKMNLPQGQTFDMQSQKRFFNKLIYIDIEKLKLYQDQDQGLTKTFQKKRPKIEAKKLAVDYQRNKKPESEKSDQEKQSGEKPKLEKSNQEKQSGEKQKETPIQMILRGLWFLFVLEIFIKFFFRMLNQILRKNEVNNADSSSDTIRGRRRKSEIDYFLEEVMTYTTFVDLLKRKKIEKITIERVDEYQFHLKPKLTPIKVHVKDSNEQKKLFVLDVNSFLEYLEVYQSHSLKTSDEEMVPVEFSRPYSCRACNF